MGRKLLKITDAKIKEKFQNTLGLKGEPPFVLTYIGLKCFKKSISKNI